MPSRAERNADAEDEGLRPRPSSAPVVTPEASDQTQTFRGTDPAAPPVVEEGLEPADAPTTFGKYQLFAKLGRGGMADVFLAVARGPMGFNKLVVVKVLRGSLTGEPEFVQMFLTEARLAARLSHANVVQTYEVGQQGGHYFIAMEYLEGQPLNTIVRRMHDAPIDHVMCARIVSEGLAGLHHAHELRDYDGKPLEIIHRDVSPHNLFVTYDGHVKLVDFGIAKAAFSQNQTDVGVLKGKVAYMAPEQAMGNAIDRRADIFPMGIILWELVTGRRLMYAGSTAATLRRVLLDDPAERASTVVPDLDPKLDDIIAKALEKDPDKRYQTAQEMREALENWIEQSGKIIREEEIGRRVTSMFAAMRERVKREVQTYMAVLETAGPSDDLAIFNDDALRTASGHLPTLGTSSRSGSARGADSGARSDVSQPAAPARGRERTLLVAVGVLGGAVLLGVTFLIVQYSRRPLGEAVASAVSTVTVTVPAPASTPTSAALASPPQTAAAMPSAREAPTASAATSAPPIRKTPPRATVHPGSRGSSAPAVPDVAPGFLTLDTVPWSHVSEGGRLLGTTPIIGVELTPGAHVLVLENPEQGLRTTFTIMVKSGDRISRRVVLKPTQ